MNWDEYGRKYGVGAAGGAGSCGGLIPLANEAIQKKIDYNGGHASTPHLTEDEMKAAAVSWGINVIATAAIVGPKVKAKVDVMKASKQALDDKKVLTKQLASEAQQAQLSWLTRRSLLEATSETWPCWAAAPAHTVKAREFDV